MKKCNMKVVKRIMLLLVTVLLLSGCEELKEEKSEYMQVSMDEAVTMMAELENYVILDVRTEEEFKEKHIPGAICIPNESISQTEPEELPDKEQTIFVYCRSGNRSKQAAEKLANIGYTNIVEFGGIIDWTGDTESSN